MKCPHCSSELKLVHYPGGTLNREQWESVKAGDWFCDSGTGNVYFWNRHLLLLAANDPKCAEYYEQIAKEEFPEPQMLKVTYGTRTETLLLEILAELKEANKISRSANAWLEFIANRVK